MAIKTETYFEDITQEGTKKITLSAEARCLIEILVRDFYNEHEMCDCFQKEIETAEEILKQVKR